MERTSNFSKDIFETVTDNQENYDSIILGLLSSASRKIDCYLEHVAEAEPALTKALMEFLVGPSKSKALHLRIITSIDKDNLTACKQLMKYSEVYHMDGILGTFFIVDDSAYLYEVEDIGESKEHARRLFYSTYPQFVRMQQQLFDNLVSGTLGAKEKLREIEGGTEREFTDTIENPASTIQLAKDLIRSASFEILILFSTISSLHRAENSGLLDLLGEVSGNGVTVKVLIKIDDETTKDALKQGIKQRHERINVNFIERSVRSKLTTIIVDQAFSLAIEVKDDSKNSFDAAAGPSTYSNSESTVFTYYSMFENLWIQAEFERQGKLRQAYFHMFKGQKLKDEVYSKEWRLGEK